MAFWTVLLGFLTGFFNTASRIFDFLKTKQVLDQGRKLEQAEQAKTEVELAREQTEILTRDQTREDTIKKMEDGSFKVHGTINTSEKEIRWKNTGSCICGTTENQNDITSVAIGAMSLMVIFVLLLQ